MSTVTKFRLSLAAFVAVTIALACAVKLMPASDPPESTDPLAYAVPRHMDDVTSAEVQSCLRKAGAGVSTDGDTIIATFGARTARIQVMSSKAAARAAAEREESETGHVYAGAANNTLIWQERGIKAAGEQAALGHCLLRLSA